MYGNGIYRCPINVTTQIEQVKAEGEQPQEEVDTYDCYGLVDNHRDLPECTIPTIASCLPKHYWTACADFDFDMRWYSSSVDWQGEQDQMRLQSCSSLHAFRERTAQPGTFQCRDRFLLETYNQTTWCRGRIATHYNDSTFEKPSCPSGSVRHMEELTAFGLANCHYSGTNSFECKCYVNRTNMKCVPENRCQWATNSNGCVLNDEGNYFERVWCSGTIDESVPSIFPSSPVSNQEEATIASTSAPTSTTSPPSSLLRPTASPSISALDEPLTTKGPVTSAAALHSTGCVLYGLTWIWLTMVTI